MQVSTQENNGQHDMDPVDAADKTGGDTYVVEALELTVVGGNGVGEARHGDA